MGNHFADHGRCEIYQIDNVYITGGRWIILGEFGEDCLSDNRCHVVGIANSDESGDSRFSSDCTDWIGLDGNYGGGGFHGNLNGG